MAETLEALYDAVVRGPLIERTLTSLQMLLHRLCASGSRIAAIFTTLAVSTRVGTDFLSTLTAMFNPLPAIALLPLALLWFGLGAKSLVFVIIHSVLWAVALNTHSGFTSVSPTLRMAGPELRAARHRLCGVAAGAGGVSLDPHRAEDRLGLRLAHADRRRAGVRRERRARAASAGSSSRTATSSRSASVFAGLFTVILIGLFVESVIFRAIENATIRRWGMQN